MAGRSDGGGHEDITTRSPAHGLIADLDDAGTADRVQPPMPWLPHQSSALLFEIGFYKTVFRRRCFLSVPHDDGCLARALA
jgi:hypothetical protein